LIDQSLRNGSSEHIKSCPKHKTCVWAEMLNSVRFYHKEQHMNAIVSVA